LVTIGTNDVFATSKFTDADLLALTRLNPINMLTISNSYSANNLYVTGNDFHIGSSHIIAATTIDVSKYPKGKVGDIEFDIPNHQGMLKLNYEKGNIQGEALFGRRLNVSFIGINTSFYMPAKLLLQSPIPDNRQNTYNGTAVSKNSGFNLKWNADVMNTRGVIIEIKYDPTSFANTFATQKPVGGKEMSFYRIADDTGSFEITPELLKDIPQYGCFEIVIKRGNYYKSSAKDVILAITEVSSSFNAQ
jgi:hypothetical protein